MDLRQLRALVTIADTGSVTRASEILHIVQPALSRQLKTLEEELGVPLFERERHGMVLTAAGRQFVEHVQRALTELDKGKDEISPKTQQVSGSVMVGLLPSAADLLVSSLMGRVRQNHPLVQLRSHIAYVDLLQRSLESGDVDVALIYRRDETADRIPKEALLEESLYLVGPPEAALDMDAPVPLTYLNEIALILPAMPQGLRALVERECTAAGVHLNVAAETNSMNVQKSLVLQGVGLSILSGLVIADELARGTLTACPIEAINLKRTLYLARTPARPPTPAAAKVLDELRETVIAHVEQGRWPGALVI